MNTKKSTLTDKWLDKLVLFALRHEFIVSISIHLVFYLLFYLFLKLVIDISIKALNIEGSFLLQLVTTLFAWIISSRLASKISNKITGL